MKTRKLGNSGFEFSKIGLGTWAIGGGDWDFGWGQQDESDAIAGIVKAVDLGVNWIDTAAVYGAGQSEILVGKALKEISENDRPIVATKCGRINHADGSVFGRINRESIFAECDASLKRLGIDCIDLYQLHWPDPDPEIEEAWRAMSELVDQGKVKQIGVSNHNVEQMQRLLPIHEIASLQPPYNMLNRSIEDSILPFCESENIGVICYSPMGKGLLTGKFDLARAQSLDSNDHRTRDPKFASPQLEINLKLVETIRKIADNHNRPLAQLSVAWALRNEVVTSAIVGVRRPDQIEEIVEAANWELTDDENAMIDQALAVRERELEEVGVVDQGRV